MRTRKRRNTEAPTPHIQPALPLHVARKCAQLSQSELAKRAGIDRAYVNQLESGARDIRKAGLEIASRIAWALHVSVADLWPLVEFTDGQRIRDLDEGTRDEVGARS